VEKKYKYRCGGCNSIWDFPMKTLLSPPCPICGRSSMVASLFDANSLFEDRDSVLFLVPSPLSVCERKELYESREELKRGMIMHCLKLYKIGDGGKDTWGPCCPRETFSIHESDFEKIVEAIILQLKSL